jgi:hypothetical protein
MSWKLGAWNSWNTLGHTGPVTWLLYLYLVTWTVILTNLNEAIVTWSSRPAAIWWQCLLAHSRHTAVRNFHLAVRKNRPAFRIDLDNCLKLGRACILSYTLVFFVYSHLINIIWLFFNCCPSVHVDNHTIITPTKCTLLLLKAPDTTICTFCLIFCPYMCQPAWVIFRGLNASAWLKLLLITIY